MSYEDALSEALRCALEQDLAEEDCREAVSRKAAQMAGMDSDCDSQA
jgi:hypothetical protein